MNQPLFEDVLTAISSLIADEALNGHPANKFRNISALSEHASGIRKLGVARVVDAGALMEDGGSGFSMNPILLADPTLRHIPDPDHPDHSDYVGLGMNGIAQPHPHPRLPGGDMRPEDLIRTVADQLDQVKAMLETPVARLDKLVGIRETLVNQSAPDEQLATIDRAIALVIAKLDQETSDADEHRRNNPDMVPFNFLRGYSDRSPDGQDLRGDHYQAHAEGEGSVGEAGCHVSKEGLEGYCDQRGGSEHAAIADRPGGKGAREDAQTRPNDRLGGEIQRRDDGRGPRNGFAIDCECVGNGIPARGCTNPTHYREKLLCGCAAGQCVHY